VKRGRTTHLPLSPQAVHLHLLALPPQEWEAGWHLPLSLLRREAGVAEAQMVDERGTRGIVVIGIGRGIEAIGTEGMTGIGTGIGIGIETAMTGESSLL
jgi:hypothetical protein